jgi:hypothetical protein
MSRLQLDEAALRTARGGLYLVLLVGASRCGFDATATAATIVAPNVFTSSDAPGATVGVFRGGNADITFQWVFPASDFSTVPLGSPITAIGFRLDLGNTTRPASPINIAQWNLQLSKSTSASLTLNPTFAANVAPDVVTVRSGPLTIPVNAFPGLQNPNPFYDIPFTTSYLYTGGNLLVTLKHTAHSGEQSLISNDADVVSGGRGQSNSNSGFTATSGDTNIFHFPVTRFTFVPEPASLLLVGCGLMPFALVSRRRGRFTAKVSRMPSPRLN